MAWTGNFDRLFIDGDWVVPSSEEQIEVISPFTEEVVAHVPSGNKTDIDAAVAAAQRALNHGPWSRTTLADRIAVLERVSQALADNNDLIADVITDEMGCPISQSRPLQANVARVILNSYIELSQQYPYSQVRRSSTGNALVTREPVGVVAGIVPWNVPLAITMHKLAPALLSGCTLVLKPAPESPLDAYLLAELLQSAGLPAGVVNVVPADREVSEYLVTHRGVNKVGFTGSTAAGRRIASLCGNDLKKVTLELGGKSAALILDDADLDTTVESLRLGSFRNSGQICTLKTRLVVSKRRENELLDRLTALVGSMPVGDPSDPATQIGPMVSARQRDRVEGYIGIGREEGAKTVVGGGRPSGLDRGWFVEPTVFSGVTPDMRIAQEEIFGPVVAVLTYDNEDEAVAIANDSPYGLNGSVFSADAEHAFALAQRIRSGTVEVNGSPAGWYAPFGGFKDSGLGREGGLEGFDSYVEIKSVGLPRELADKLA